MKSPKWIIENGVLIIAKANYHRDMAKDTTKVVGGGWWDYDKETHTFLLYGLSTDFGQVTDKQFEDCKLHRRVRNATVKFTRAFSLEDAKNTDSSLVK